MIPIPLFVLTWIAFLLFRSVFILLGLVVIPPLAIFWKYTSRIETSRVGGKFIRNWKYKVFYPWSNDEDGIIAGEELPNAPDWVRIIYWSAIRNPANNLRFIPGISCKVKPSKVNYIGTQPRMLNGYVTMDEHLLRYDMDSYRFISLTWCGNYSNLRVQFKMFNKIWRFWIGWKIYPHDILGMDPTDYRFEGAGFATQFKRIYPRK